MTKNSSDPIPVASKPLDPSQTFPNIEYNQPLSSCYEHPTVTIQIGNKEYNILESHVQKYPLLNNGPATSPVWLCHVDDDVGHTLVHFLYSGTYETTRLPLDANVSHIEREYERSVMVYLASRMYDIPDLQILARKYIEYFGKGISTIDFLRSTKRIFSKLPEDEVWLPSYLKRALQRSFASNNSRFYFNRKSCILNDHGSFTSAIMLLMIEIQSLHIERLETGSMLNSTGEPTSTECLVVENMPIAPTEYPVSEDWLTPTSEDDTVVALDEDAAAVPEKEAVPEESLVEIPHGTYAITSQADPESMLTKRLLLNKNHYRDWANLPTLRRLTMIRILRQRDLPIPDVKGFISIPVQALFSTEFST